MARDYGKIFTAAWGDEQFRSLGRNAQHLYMQLVSQPDLSMAGILTIAPVRWAQQAHITEPEVMDSLATLTERRFVHVDQGTQELLVRSYVRRDEGWKSPTTMKAIASAMNAVLSPGLKSVLADEVSRIDTNALSEKVSEKTGRSTKEVVMGYISTFLASVKPHQVPPAIPHPDTPSDTPSGRASDTPTDGLSFVRARTEPEPEPEPANATTPEPEPPSGGPRKRGTRLPADWTPSDTERQYAAERNVNAERESEKFRNYWHAKSGSGAAKLDWSATWRNWVLTAAERQPRPAPEHGWSPPAGSALSYVEM